MASDVGNKDVGGLGDILSMALQQTGVESVTPPSIALDSRSILNAAANTLNSSLLSSDIGALTEGLFSTLAMVKEAPKNLSADSCHESIPTTTQGARAEIPTVSRLEPITPLSDETSLNSSLASTAVQSSLLQPETAPTYSNSLTVSELELDKPEAGRNVMMQQSPFDEIRGGTMPLEPQSSYTCTDDDIDLDKLFSVDESAADQMPLPGMDVGNTMPIGGPLPMLDDLAVPIEVPPFTSLDTSSSVHVSSSSNNGLASLLDISGSQYLENLSPSTGDKSSSNGNLRVPVSCVGDISDSASTAVSVGAELLSPAATVASTGPLSDATLTSLLPPLNTIPPTPSLVSFTPSTPSLSTHTNTTSTRSIPTTKLDVAAILKEVVDQADPPGGMDAVTTNVSGRVIPEPGRVSMVVSGSAGKKPSLFSLAGRAPLASKPPLALVNARLDCHHWYIPSVILCAVSIVTLYV